MFFVDAMLALERDPFETIFATKDGILGTAVARIAYAILVFIEQNGGLNIIFLLGKFLHHD